MSSFADWENLREPPLRMVKSKVFKTKAIKPKVKSKECSDVVILTKNLKYLNVVSDLNVLNHSSVVAGQKETAKDTK